MSQLSLYFLYCVRYLVFCFFCSFLFVWLLSFLMNKDIYIVASKFTSMVLVHLVICSITQFRSGTGYLVAITRVLGPSFKFCLT